MIPVFYGWGRYTKKIADIGLTECSNCNNIVGAELHQSNKGVKLYFVQVAKWDKHFFVVCPVCQAGYEVSAEEKDEILQKTLTLPKNQISIAIWNNLMERLNESVKEKDENSEDFFGDKMKQKIINQLVSQGYNQDDIEYVYSYLALYLVRKYSSDKKE
jgi:hypothetical protein